MPIHSMQSQADAAMMPSDEMSMDQESVLANADITDPIEVLQADLSFDDSASDGKWYVPSANDDDGGDYSVEIDDTEGAGLQGNLDMGALNGVGAEEAADDQPAQYQDSKPRRRAGSDIHATNQADDSSGDDGQFSPELLERARMYGMTEQDAMSYSSERDLERTIFELDRRALNDGMRAQQQQQAYHYGYQQQPQQPSQQPWQQQQYSQQYQQQPPEQGQPPQPQTQDQVQQPDQFELPEFDLDVTMLDEGAAEVLGEMKSHYDQAFQKMLQHNRMVQQRVEFAERFAQEQQARQQREYQENYMREFDNAINDLGEQFQEVLGKGVTGELNPQSQEFYNRDQLWRAQAAAMQAHAVNGLRPNVKDVVASAARVLFPQQYEKILRNGVRNQASRRQSQMVSRPTRRQSQPSQSEQQASKREAALRRFDNAMINSGIGVDPTGDVY